MSSQDQPGQPPEDGPEPSEDTQLQLAGRFSLYRNKSGWLRITLSAIAVVGLSAALIAVGFGGGTHQGASSGPRLVQGTGLGTPSGKDGRISIGTGAANGEVISAAKAAENGGALSLPKSTQSSVVKWLSGPGGTDLAAVSNRLGDALQAAGIGQYASMKNACIQLAGSVTIAQAGPQIPVVAMQKLYAKALMELAKGSADCRIAISTKPDGEESVDAHVDARTVRLSISELGAGARDVFRSTAEIEIASRQRH
jgi:hypothetical protein